MLYETHEPDQIDEAIARLRKEYAQQTLDVTDVDPDPLRQFQAWFDSAVRARIPEANAMYLATATPDGRPSGRMVLLKGLSSAGLAFYTNYESRKASELEANPRAALTFFWQPLERQVRVEGAVRRKTEAESEAYFSTRPYETRIGAWASPQSRILTDRAELEDRFRQMRERFPDDETPLPPHWGGYLVVPDRFEFWQGRKSRLHDRIVYRKDGESWAIERLAP